MLLPKGTRARSEWFTQGDEARILEWDGIPTPEDKTLKGTKMAVLAWMFDFAFSEGRVKPEFVKAIIEKSLYKRLITKEDLALYGR
jgi:hypothetical protein